MYVINVINLEPALLLIETLSGDTGLRSCAIMLNTRRFLNACLNSLQVITLLPRKDRLPLLIVSFDRSPHTVPKQSVISRKESLHA